MRVRRSVSRLWEQSRALSVLQSGARPRQIEERKLKPFPFMIAQYEGDERWPGDEHYLPRFVFIHTDAAGRVEFSDELLGILRLRVRA